MKKDLTASYIVTPPTLFLAREGMCFTLISRDKEWVEEVMSAIEDSMQSITATVYANFNNNSDEHWVWMFQHMAVSDFVLVDCATATEFDKMLAVSNGPSEAVWWIDPSELEDNMAALLHTTGAQVVGDVEEFFSLISQGL